MFFAYFLARQKVGRHGGPRPAFCKQIKHAAKPEKIELDLKRQYMEPRMKLYVSSSQNQHKTVHSNPA